MSPAYSDAYIGECTSGSCDRPATARVYEGFVLCALHHTMHEAGEQNDAAELTLELVKGWRSQAKMHGLDALELELWRIAINADQHAKESERLREQLERIDHEDHGFEMRMRTAGGPS